MLKDSLFIIVFGVFMYLGIATVIGVGGVVGSYGELFAHFNHKYFGYLSYIYIFVLLYPLFLFYKNTTYNLRKVEIFLALFLLSFAFLLAQSILVHNDFRGQIGGDFVDFLSPTVLYMGIKNRQNLHLSVL